MKRGVENKSPTEEMKNISPGLTHYSQEDNHRKHRTLF